MKNLLDSLIGTKVSVTTDPNNDSVVIVCGKLRSIPSISETIYIVANDRDFPDTDKYCIISVRFTFKLVGTILESSTPHIILTSNEKPS